MNLIDLPFNEWLDNVCLGALSHPATVKASYDIARLVIDNNIPGDFVECGVFGGAQCAAMARAIMDSNSQDRRVHLFDCFEGIPAPGEHDTDIEAGMHEAFQNQTACSLEDCRRHMHDWGIPEKILCYHQGLFADEIPAAIREEGRYARHTWLAKIAILRLDGDLYESTRVCLDNLYPLLSPGGWCIVDDMGLVGARKAVDEYMKNLSRPTYWQKS